MVRFGMAVCVFSIATFAAAETPAQAAPAAPAAPGGTESVVAVPVGTSSAPTAAATARPRSHRLVAPLMAPLAIPPKATVTVQVPAPTTVKVAAVPTAADQAAIVASAQDAAAQSSQQLDKFQQVYEDATKIFGAEHTVISPSFFVATDIQGRLSATDKHEAGLSATLLLPLIGIGGGHGKFDWWPVLASSDETQIYQTFLSQLDQYQQAETNVKALGGDIDAIAHTKWNVQNLLVAKQLFCQEELDPELPPDAAAAIKKLCAGTLSTTITPTTTNGVTSIDPTPEQQLVINTVSPPTGRSDAVTLERHNFLIGPSLGIPLTKNPTDIFQLGASAEIGDEAFRIMATGGLVGRYQGATYKDIFAAGWFVGFALSGQIGDELFHYFNGGSNLMNQLAQIKNNPPPPQ